MRVFLFGVKMSNFRFIRGVASTLETTLEYLTKDLNVIIKEIHIVPGKTTIKYEVITNDGFSQKELFFLNEIKQ